MAEYIGKQAAINAVRSYYDEFDKRKESIEERIEQMPAADVQPVRHGRWKLQNDRSKPLYGWLFCSECGAYIGEPTNYCSNCGERMDGRDGQEGTTDGL